MSEHAFDNINILLMYKVMKVRYSINVPAQGIRGLLTPKTSVRYSIDVPAQGIRGLLTPKTSVYFSTVTYDILQEGREDWTDYNFHSCKPSVSPLFSVFIALTRPNIKFLTHPSSTWH